MCQITQGGGRKTTIKWQFILDVFNVQVTFGIQTEFSGKLMPTHIAAFILKSLISNLPTEKFCRTIPFFGAGQTTRCSGAAVNTRRIWRQTAPGTCPARLLHYAQVC